MRSAHTFFEGIEIAPDDPILSLPALFTADSHAEKVNLGIGSYRTAEAKPYLLQSVIAVEEQLAKQAIPKEYLPMEGYPLFIEEMMRLVLGEKVDKDGVYAVQTIGGTFALRMAADFLAPRITPVVAISDPSWSNHTLIFKAAGFQVKFYPYYNVEKHAREIDAMIAFLKTLPSGSLVLLQTACHNPTGSDLTQKEWQAILKVMQEGRLLPFFDNAYQGFSQSIEEDVYPIQLFMQHGMEMLIATSCSKNFGLYGERVGALFLIVQDPAAKKAIGSQIKQLIRSMYSTPPIHGGRLVAEILHHPQLKKNWLHELDNMRSRVQEMREALTAGLLSKSGNPMYQFLEEENGFFSLLGISEKDVLRLRQEKGIYMPSNGRINIAGLTPYNIEYVIDALLSL